MTFEHELYSTVRINALEMDGIVVTILISDIVQYEVRYTYEGDVKSVVFYNFEISKVDDDN